MTLLLPGIYSIFRSKHCNIRDHLARRPLGDLSNISHFNGWWSDFIITILRGTSEICLRCRLQQELPTQWYCNCIPRESAVDWHILPGVPAAPPPGVNKLLWHKNWHPFLGQKVNSDRPVVILVLLANV